MKNSQIKSRMHKLARPPMWPILWRRLALLTMPISLAIWLALVVVGVVVAVVGGLVRQIVRLWTAPPRRFRSYGNYGRRSFS